MDMSARDNTRTTWETCLEFVWSDDLAKLLVQEDGVEHSELSHWILTPVGYRLPDQISAVDFARELFAYDRSLPTQRAI